MTPSARRLVSRLVIAAGIVIVCVLAIVKLWPHAPPRTAPDFVPESWAQYRTTPGHALHVGQGKAQCHDCHNIERDGFKNPGTAVCANCHAKEAAVAHRGGPGSNATGCLTCHVFALARTAPRCIDCHAQPQGDRAAVLTHATTDCAKCHRPHETPSIVPADCTSCHEERAAKHVEHEGSKGCADCHRPHQPAAVAIAACASCHAEAAQPHPAAHDGCIGCHQPHDFAPNPGVCVGCHGAKTILAESEVSAHRACVNCHTPHAPGGARSACVGCHQDVQVTHGNAGACINCHVPHGDDPAFVATTCTTCHSKVAASDRSAHAGGIACESCHKPHGFSGLVEKVVCQSCHLREVTLAASNPGHAACTSCHGASVEHAPAKAVVCATCHVAEQKSAPAGHQACVGCHEPHAGQPTPACATCHANKVSEPHGSIAGGCETCHRPHGPRGLPAPPACQTCHAPGTLPALHAVAGHAVCASCHASPHAPPHEDRAACTGTCHVNKRDHQPGAQVCAGCHVFRR
jgi:hypothetical protein